MQHADHGIVWLGGRGIGQFRGGGPQQFMPQTPLGQFDVVMHVSHLNGGAFLSVAFFQAGADQIDVGSLDANLAVAEIDDVMPARLSDPSLDGLAVAEDEYSLVRWIRWRGRVPQRKAAARAPERPSTVTAICAIRCGMASGRVRLPGRVKSGWPCSPVGYASATPFNMLFHWLG